MNKFQTFIFVLAVISAHDAYALKCGHVLVDIGDYKDDVYEKCGSPSSVNSHYERRGSGNQAQINQFNYNQGQINIFNNYRGNNFNYGQNNYREIEVLIEEWKYDFGRQRLRKLLRFENGQLTEIISLGK